jgi:hypothetical protein
VAFADREVIRPQPQKTALRDSSHFSNLRPPCNFSVPPSHGIHGRALGPWPKKLGRWRRRPQWNPKPNALRHTRQTWRPVRPGQMHTTRISWPRAIQGGKVDLHVVRPVYRAAAAMKRRLCLVFVLASAIGCSSRSICYPQASPVYVTPMPCTDPCTMFPQRCTATAAEPSINQLYQLMFQTRTLIDNETTDPAARGMRQELRAIREQLGAIQSKLP